MFSFPKSIYALLKCRASVAVKVKNKKLSSLAKQILKESSFNIFLRAAEIHPGGVNIFVLKTNSFETPKKSSSRKKDVQEFFSPKKKKEHLKEPISNHVTVSKTNFLD